MPRVKIKGNATKRFRVRPGGVVKRGQSFKRFILEKNSKIWKRKANRAVRDTKVEPNDPWPNPRSINV